MKNNKIIATFILSFVVLSGCIKGYKHLAEISTDLESHKVYLSDVEGSGYIFKVESDGYWKLTISNSETSEWLDVFPLEGGKGTTPVTLTTRNANKDGVARTEYLHIVSGCETIEVSVIQNQNNVLGLSKRSINFTKDGGKETITLYKNIDYSIEMPMDALWLTRLTSKLITEEGLTFAATENNTGEERTAIVKMIGADGNVVQELAVIQEQNNVLGIDRTEINFVADGGEEFVTLSKNIAYTVYVIM